MGPSSVTTAVTRPSVSVSNADTFWPRCNVVPKARMAVATSSPMSGSRVFMGCGARSTRWVSTPNAHNASAISRPT